MANRFINFFIRALNITCMRSACYDIDKTALPANVESSIGGNAALIRPRRLKRQPAALQTGKYLSAGKTCVTIFKRSKKRHRMSYFSIKDRIGLILKRVAYHPCTS